MPTLFRCILNVVKSILLLGLFSVLLSCSSTPPQNLKPESKADSKLVAPSWAANMQELTELLLKIEPQLMDEAKFLSATEDAQLKKDIRRMAEVSKNVTHNPTLLSRDPTVRFVASQFSQDIQRSAESFEQGRKEFSRYQLLKVSGYCIECHTRTQQGPQYQDLAKNKNLKALNRFQRAEFHIAARVFDEALKLLEEEVQSEEAAAGFSRIERAARYGLMITVQLQADPARALSFVGKIESSKAAPFALKEKAKNWKKDILAWQSEKAISAGAGISAYRKLAERRDSEVSLMRALAGILPWLTTDLKKEELGEGLYLVGTCYEGLTDLSLFNLHENYFESCVRLVPHTGWAKKCYTKLEDSIKFGYSGSSGTHVPVEVQMYLDGLKKEFN